MTKFEDIGVDLNKVRSTKFRFDFLTFLHTFSGAVMMSKPFQATDLSLDEINTIAGKFV